VIEWLLHYVPHDQVAAYEAAGWRVEADTAHHRHNSVLMRLEAKDRGVEYVKPEAA
jgi:hypothetical protein